MTTSLPDRLVALLDEAGLSMTRLAGGTAVCTFSRAGIPVPGIKYAEGGWAALREVQRATAAGAELGLTAATTTAAWQAHFDAAVARAQSRDWIAYRAGGVDALSALLDTADDGEPNLA